MHRKVHKRYYDLIPSVQWFSVPPRSRPPDESHVLFPGVPGLKSGVRGVR